MNIREDGVEIIRGLIPPPVAISLAAEVEVSKVDVSKHGVRNANVQFEGIGALARDSKLLEHAASILGGEPKLVRAIFFDKTPDKNWLVTWHQDRTIAVDRKVDIEGWGPWSIKAGVHHVQPPLEVLNSMVTFRIHLDAADEANGCLRVIPGSQAMGIIDSKDVPAICESAIAFDCVVDVGDAVVMRPHILHSSSKSIRPGHRRVIHLEYCGYQLPGDMRWQCQ